MVINSEDQDGARQSFPAFSRKASKQKTQEKEPLHVLSAVQEKARSSFSPGFAETHNWIGCEKSIESSMFLMGMQWRWLKPLAKDWDS